MKYLDCGSHGRRPWHGTVICSKCGRVYHAQRDGEALVEGAESAPLVCHCGDQLLPNLGGGVFSARPICSTCFQEKLAARKPS